jgi:hypothetical protein
MTDKLRIKATKIFMNSILTADEIADVHEAMCMTGAIEFLRKAKAICDSKQTCYKCPLTDFCGGLSELEDEADLVRKVMDYQIKEDINAERN